MATESNAKVVTGLSKNDQPYDSEVLLRMDDEDNNAIPPYPVFIPPTNPKHMTFKNMRCTSKWLGKTLVGELSDHLNMTSSTIVKGAQEKYFVHISRSKVHRAKFCAQDMINGNQAAHFTNIREYCAELLRTNRGSSVLLNVVTANLPIEEIERPFIGVDACHLKGHYGGQLMTAVATDSNNQLFPLAFAVVEAKTKDSWTWFILKLISDVNASSQRRLTFIFDQQKGLMPTFEELMPGVDHRLCVRHLYNNFKKKYPGLILRDIFWRIATATYYKQWDKAMKELKSVSMQASGSNRMLVI
ncbi:uncharacterized protein LOC126700702 [Quercus robur]|uniref:uncharacterized protein LOC126700702 n=1 Tax=Quercus robur TaxID=38942 RepID=UPI002161781E|nr:uncharacterized protein LOC126700702 [Quercus robur]